MGVTVQFVNDPSPWTRGVNGELSIQHLVNVGTLSAEQAALMCLAVEHGASLFTAGGPSGAGKTTLANALMAHLPAGARIYVVAGNSDELNLPTDTSPLYVLVSEFSDHPPPMYVAGEPARRIMSLINADRRVIGTLHAPTVADAAIELRDEFGLTSLPERCAAIVGLMRVTRGEVKGYFVDRHDPTVERRLAGIGILTCDRNGLKYSELTSWNEEELRLEPEFRPAGLQAFATWLRWSPDEATNAIAARARQLSVGQRV